MAKKKTRTGKTTSESTNQKTSREAATGATPKTFNSEMIEQLLRAPLTQALSTIQAAENPRHAELDEQKEQLERLKASSPASARESLKRAIKDLEDAKEASNHERREMVARTIVNICSDFKIPLSVKRRIISTVPRSRRRPGNRGLRKGGSLDMLAYIAKEKDGVATTSDCMEALPDKGNQGISQILTNLKSKGYVEAESIKGQKGSRYRLTDKGREELERKQLI